MHDRAGAAILFQPLPYLPQLEFFHICYAVNKEPTQGGTDHPFRPAGVFYELLSHSENSSKEMLPASHSAFFSLASSLQA